MDWGISITNIISSVVALIAVGVAIFVILRSRLFTLRSRFMLEHELERQREYLRYVMERETPERGKSEQKTLAEIVAEKKRKFQNITSISFHFVDEAEVTNFYNDIFKEPTVTSLVTQIVGEVTSDVKARIPQVLETRFGGRDLSKWISTVKMPDTSLPGMFARYQREAIEHGEVTLGLEELEVELNELQQFEAAVDNLQKSFVLTLDPGMVDTKTRELKEKAVETMLSELEKASGWVLIEGRFNIDKADGEMYRCTYNHPVNEYRFKEASPITISFTIRASSIHPRYADNYARSSGRLIPLHVYGNVWQPISRDMGIWDLVIIPLAIY